MAGGVGVQEEEQKWKRKQEATCIERVWFRSISITRIPHTNTHTQTDIRRHTDIGGGRGKGSTRRFTHSISVWHTQRKSTPFEAEWCNYLHLIKYSRKVKVCGSKCCTERCLRIETRTHTHAHTYTYKYIYQFYILATPLVLSALLRCLKIHKFKLAQGQWSHRSVFPLLLCPTSIFIHYLIAIFINFSVYIVVPIHKWYSITCLHIPFSPSLSLWFDFPFACLPCQSKHLIYWLGLWRRFLLPKWQHCHCHGQHPPTPHHSLLLFPLSIS